MTLDLFNTFTVTVTPQSLLWKYRVVMKLRTPGKFGCTFANSGNPDETAPYEPSHQNFHCLLS